MSRIAAARIAGFALLFYIAIGITSAIVAGGGMAGEGMAEKLSGIGQHAADMRIVVLLSLLQSFCAVVLGVTLWAVTRDEDPNLAMLGMVFRVGEGFLGAVGIPGTLALLQLATSSGADAADPGPAHVLARYLLTDSVALTATFFAVGSTFFSWLLLRGRLIPVVLAWIGVVASVLLVAYLPLQLAGYVRGTMLVWMPMLVFEVPLGIWLLVKGVRP